MVIETASNQEACQLIMAMTGRTYVRIRYCQPAFRNNDAKVGQHLRDTIGLNAIEVTQEAFENPASIVFNQSENRMRSI